MSQENKNNVSCPTCKTQYLRGTPQANIVEDCGECAACDKVRSEEHEDMPPEGYDEGQACTNDQACHCEDCLRN